jgi:hypothetical protein
MKLSLYTTGVTVCERLSDHPLLVFIVLAFWIIFFVIHLDLNIMFNKSNVSMKSQNNK